MITPNCDCPICGAEHNQALSRIHYQPAPIIEHRVVVPKTTVDFVYRYPVVHDIHHVQRQSRYTTVEEIEKPLRERYLALNRQLIELRVYTPPPKEVDYTKVQP